MHLSVFTYFNIYIYNILKFKLYIGNLAKKVKELKYILYAFRNVLNQINLSHIYFGLHISILTYGIIGWELSELLAHY